MSTTTSSSSSGSSAGWRFSQVFTNSDTPGNSANAGGSGNNKFTRQVTEGDILSAVAFDPTGEFLATGDKGGQVCVFRRKDGRFGAKGRGKPSVTDADSRYAKKRGGSHADDDEDAGEGAVAASGKKKRGPSSSSSATASPSTSAAGMKFSGFVEFQSHHPGFDYLKSLEIEEKINQIKWCNRTSNALVLLSTNDKTIKLWKLSMRNQLKQVASLSAAPKGAGKGKLSKKSAKMLGSSSPGSTGSAGLTSSRDLIVPRLQRTNKTIVCPKEARTYADAHTYHINSVSVSSDGINFLSADDLRIYLWDINRCYKYNIVDIKPSNMEDLTEVVTAATYHPINSQLFMFSSSCGQLKLGDLRRGSVCTEFQTFFESDNDLSKPFFSEIVASISDIQFSRDGRYAVSRDYLRVRLWDLAMPHKAVKTIPVNSNLQGKLIELYENDSIFDKFEISVNHDTSQFVTGSYNGNFHVYNIDGTISANLRADKFHSRYSKPLDFGGSVVRGSSAAEPLDVSRKVLHTAWHPTQNAIAVTCHDSVYVYTQD